MGFKLVEAPKQRIKSSLSKGVCQRVGVAWLGQGRVLITKVSVGIMDGVCWEQNLEMLVWLGENVLRCP